MRNRCRGKYSPAVASVIVRNYSRLMERLCASQSGPVQGAMDDADIMQETFLHVTQFASTIGPDTRHKAQRSGGLECKQPPRGGRLLRWAVISLPPGVPV